MTLATIILIGHLGKDPEVTHTQQGTLVKVSVAESRRKKEGESYVDDTEWWSCTAFGRNAELLAKYCQKGSHVCLTLSKKTSSKDWKWFTNFYVNSVKFLDKKGDSKPRADSGLAYNQQTAVEQSSNSYALAQSGQSDFVINDDLPF